MGYSVTGCVGRLHITPIVQSIRTLLQTCPSAGYNACTARVLITSRNEVGSRH